MALYRADQLSTSPLQYTVQDMMPKGVGWVYGSPYVGKSFLIGIELCLAVANGRPFLGHETEQGTALWALAEGLDDAGLRVKGRLIREQHDRKMLAAEIARLSGQAAADTWLAAQPPFTDENLKIEDDGFTIPFTAGTPGQPTEELRLKAAELSTIEDLRLIVLDTAQLFTDLSIDNATTSKRFMKGMKWLSRQLGCTVLGITHPVPKGHGETGLPGTQLKALADFVWRVQADETGTEDEPRSVITAEKIKSSSLFRPITYRLEEIPWKQPPVDPETEEELDVPEDEYVTVGTVTVRLCEDEQPASSQPAPASAGPRKPLPEAIPVPARARKHIRTGIKPSTPFRVIPAPAPVPAPDPDSDESKRAALVAALVSVPCPRDGCPAKAGESCLPLQPYYLLDTNPLVLTHAERMDAAILSGNALLDDVLAQFPDSTTPAQVAGLITAGTQA